MTSPTMMQKKPVKAKRREPCPGSGQPVAQPPLISAQPVARCPACGGIWLFRQSDGRFTEHTRVAKD